MRELEALWSATDENSEIYALDHAGGEAVAISADTEAILRFGAEMGARTGGCLDITLLPGLAPVGVHHGGLPRAVGNRACGGAGAGGL